MDALEAMRMAREALRRTVTCGHNAHECANVRAIAALDAAIAAAEPAQPVTLMDVTLDQPACELLFTMLHPCTPEDGSEYSEVRLQFGDGHGGFGLYVSSADYPEDGAVLLVKSEHTHAHPTRTVSDDGPGPGDDVACVKCGAVALDTGLECSECGHDNYEAVTGKPFTQTTVTDERLRELMPKPTLQYLPHWGERGPTNQDYYTEDQMLAFARAVLEESRK